MIGVDVFGRMGNQMFQYAFAYRIAKDFKTIFFIDDYTFPFKLHEYFELKKFRKLQNRIIRKGFKAIWDKEKIKIQNDFDIYNNKPQLSNNRIYWGYYQSELYFKKYSNDVKDQFKVKKHWVKTFESKYNDLYSNYKTIAIHFRRTDYLEQNLALPWTYYKAALKKIEDVDSYKVLVIGDDHDYAKSQLNGLKNSVFCKNHEMVDFQIISNADISIISNSTFAWWAAYLSKNEQITIAPSNWTGEKQEYPKGITSNNFEWIKY